VGRNHPIVRSDQIPAGLFGPSGLGDRAIERGKAPRDLRIRHELRFLRRHIGCKACGKLISVERQEVICRRKDRWHRCARRRILDQGGDRFTPVRGECGDVDQALDAWVVAGFGDDGAAGDKSQSRRTTTWSALDGETLISLSPGHPHQQLIDKQLLKAGIKRKTKSVVNLLDTQIALVEAEEGIAIIPSFGMPACRNRKVVMSPLINPVVRFDFHMIRPRGKQLPPEADEFTAFLKSYIATWAGGAGVL
jgi:LysR substrate binding domain